MQPCKHELCFECFRKSVLKKLICPFCQQEVISAKTTGDQFEDAELLQALYNVEQIDEFHEVSVYNIMKND